MRGRPISPFLARLLVIAAVYYTTARISLLLALVGVNVTPIWPPTGIAVVALLLFGRWAWPAITVAAFAVNLPISPSPETAAAIAVGNTLAPFAAVELLRRFRFRKSLGRLRDAVAILVSALVGTLISASIGSQALVLSGAITSGEFLQTWSVWWTGDAMGILIVAPVLLMASEIRRPPWPWRRLGEAALTFAVLAAGSVMILATARPIWVLLFPLLALIAFRFQQHGSAPAALVVSTLATWAAANDLGPFAQATLVEKMVGLQAFNAAVSFTSLFLASLVAERTQARRAMELAAMDLQRVVERRTAIAETLQQSMLPDSLPQIPDVELDARYLPASSEVSVGGDWYDAVSMDDGRLAIAIGDVAGHGVPAAATMGQMRMALRAYALDARPPALALEHLNGVLHELQNGAMATILFVQIDLHTGEFTFANAGHPPPLITSEADNFYVEGGLGPPLGAVRHRSYRTADATLPPGATMILYTDGLIERRGEPLEDGLARLLEIAAGAPEDLSEKCDHLLAKSLGPHLEDDVALVAIRRIALAGQPLFIRLPAEPASSPRIRRVLRRWLRENQATTEETHDALLACSEACTNVIQHAYGPVGGVLRVEAELRGNEIVIRVSDEGGWRPEPTTGDDGGRGLELMRATMDAVQVIPGNTGTEVRMRRKLKAQAP